MDVLPSLDYELKQGAKFRIMTGTIPPCFFFSTKIDSNPYLKVRLFLDTTFFQKRVKHILQSKKRTNVHI